MRKVLTIAGSDSGAGAGIQADLKTFAALGVYGTSAITAVTAQNTIGVQNIFVLPADFVGKQIDSVMDDIGADAWKTGMLANEEIVRVVATKARAYNVSKLVVDPVMVSKSGQRLLKKDANEFLVDLLFPLATIITPNIDEAESLTGIVIKNIFDMEKAAVALCKTGAENVVVKGGHLPETLAAVDVLFDGKRIIHLSSPRINTKNTHGTGCTFASAIAAELAKGESVEDSVRNAKKYVTKALKAGAKLRIAHGTGPLNRFSK